MKNDSYVFEKYLDSVKPLMESRIKNLEKMPFRLGNLRSKQDKRSKIPSAVKLADVAKALDTQIASVSRYESSTNHVFPSPDKLIKLVTLYGVSLDYLVLGIDYDLDSSNHTIEFKGEMLNLAQCKDKLEKAEKMIDAQKNMLRYYEDNK